MATAFSTESLVSDVIHYLSDGMWKTQWKDLISTVKKIDSVNPYAEGTYEHQMWTEQCGINLPLMYVASIYLYQWGQSHGCDTYLFATRDCCHWIKIFQAMFPTAYAVYFHCSRNMLDGATSTINPAYNDYVKSVIKTDIEHTVFIDIHGTCKRAFEYFEKQFKTVPYGFLLSASYRKYSEFPAISIKYHKTGRFINLVFDARGSPIEMLNYDDVGTLQTYTVDLGPVRDKIEYSPHYLEAYHVCVDYAVSIINPPQMSKFDQINMVSLETLIRKIYRVIQDNKPAISMYIRHPAKHPKVDPTGGQRSKSRKSRTTGTKK